MVLIMNSRILLIKGYPQDIVKGFHSWLSPTHFEGFHLFAWDGDIGRVEATDDNAIGVFV